MLAFKGEVTVGVYVKVQNSTMASTELKNVKQNANGNIMIHIAKQN